MIKRYGLHGKLKTTEGDGEKLASILLEASKLISTAKGCNCYIISKDKNDKDAVWVTEVWDSKEDHDNSLNIEGARALIAQAMPILKGQPEQGQELEILGGAGLSEH